MAHKFNGVDVRTPTSFSWDLEEEETSESGMTQTGKDYSDILAEKRTLNYEWNDPTKEEVAIILTLINQKRYTDITYPDAMSNAYLTKEFKATKKSVPFRELRVGAQIYSSLSLSFKER